MFRCHARPGENIRSEMMVLTDDLDQYLQEVYHHLDSRGRGWIPREDFHYLLEVLNISGGELSRSLNKDVSFAEFHSRLCEYFANKSKPRCVQFFDSLTKSLKMREESDLLGNKNRQMMPFTIPPSVSDDTSVRYVEFRQYKDERNFTLSSSAVDIEQRTGVMLRELTRYKEEAQSLREIVEELKCGLQASDARNLALQVVLRKSQAEQQTGYSSVVLRNKKRYSCPWDMLCYQPLAGEEHSVKVLTRELSQVRELRDSEVKELMELNRQLQDDICDISREVCDLEETNAKLVRRLESIFGAYDKHKELLAGCVLKVRQLEEHVGVIPTLEEKLSELKELALTWKTTEEITKAETKAIDWKPITDKPTEMETESEHTSEKQTGEQCSLFEDMVAPEFLLLGNLKEEVDEKTKLIEENSEELDRTREDLSMCRRHLLSAQFQIEALENECSRLLSLEDQIVSVVTLLQKARQQCLSRQTLGQFILDIIDSGTEDENEGPTAQVGWIPFTTTPRADSTRKRMEVKPGAGVGGRTHAHGDEGPGRERLISKTLLPPLSLICA
ncbi:hypothetical protein ScPMuIL_007630 [Solemya velum]